jgi:hypothetical protein
MIFIGALMMVISIPLLLFGLLNVLLSRMDRDRESLRQGLKFMLVAGVMLLLSSYLCSTNKMF